MNSLCPHCQKLMTEGKEQNHPGLSLISAMPHSELHKCDLCKSYLHKFGGEWEVLISGGYGQDSSGLDPSSLDQGSSSPSTDSTTNPQLSIDFLKASGQ